MPVYEYLCRACEHEFEREQRISDNPIKKCPACGAMKAKRLID
jgi:putative FmdB family regulatory protein